MKKALIISTIIFVIAAVLFGISVAATGVNENGFGISISGIPLVQSFNESLQVVKEGETKTYTFENTVNNLEIDVMSAEMDIKTADVDKITVKYTTTTGGYAFSANVMGETLYIEEESGFLFNLIFFGLNDKDSRLEVVLPEKEYNNVEFDTASGGGIVDGIICKNLTCNTASGYINYNVFADRIEVNSASGGSTVTNCTENKAGTIVLSSVSGEHRISGFKADKYEFNSTSGTIHADRISGRVNANIISGEIYIDYAEWTDTLDLDAVSGSFDITLPEDAGVKIDLSAVSGDVEVKLGEDEVKVSGDSETGRIGGDNVQNVNIDLVSGDVYIHN